MKLLKKVLLTAVAICMMMGMAMTVSAADEKVGDTVDVPTDITELELQYDDSDINTWNDDSGQYDYVWYSYTATTDGKYRISFDDWSFDGTSETQRFKKSEDGNSLEYVKNIEQDKDMFWNINLEDVVNIKKDVTYYWRIAGEGELTFNLVDDTAVPVKIYDYKSYENFKTKGGTIQCDTNGNYSFSGDDSLIYMGKSDLSTEQTYKDLIDSYKEQYGNRFGGLYVVSKTGDKIDVVAAPEGTETIQPDNQILLLDAWDASLDIIEPSEDAPNVYSVNDRTFEASVDASKLSYQWQMSDTEDGTFTNIDGATNSSYALTKADGGKYLRLQIKADGYAGEVYSNTYTTLFDINGYAKLSGKLEFDQTLSVDVTSLGIPNTDSSLTYEWYRIDEDWNSSLIEGVSQPTYKLTADDINNKIRVLVSTNKAGWTGIAVIETEAVVAKAAQETPTQPSLKLVTENTITVDAIAGQEYSKDNINWQASGEFDNLTVDSEYKIYTHKPGDATHEESEASKPLTVKTTKPNEKDIYTTPEILPANELAGLDATKTVTYVVNDGENEAYSWTIKGADVTDATIPLNLALTIRQKKSDDLVGIPTKAIVLDFAQEGALPGKATVKAYVGDDLAYCDVEVYHVNGKTLDQVGSTYTVDANGYISFDITSCSNYVVTHVMESISLNKTSVALDVGGSVTLSTTLKPSDSVFQKKATWKSSNTAVATVDGNGKVVAKAKGTATITATVGGKSVSCSVTVSMPLPTKNKTYTVGKAKYKVTKSAETGGTVTFMIPTKKTYTSFTVPKTVKINGYTFNVTAINAKAFKKNTKLKSVKIETGVKTIGKEAFYGCSKLKTITVKSTKITSVGKNAFKKIYKKATIKVPKSKYKTYSKKTFKGKGQPSSVKIKK